jgi:hypothetical protein
MEVPLGLEQGDHDADDEEVIGIGEETHARDGHDLDLEPADLRVVQRIEKARLGCRRHGSAHLMTAGSHL